MSENFDKALSFIMVFAPTIVYFDQYRTVYKNKSSLGFNLNTIAILCFSNILRYFFWIGKGFDNTLLYQSIAMIITMMYLLEIVVRYKPKNVYFKPLIRQDSTSAGSSYHHSTVAEFEERVELKLHQRLFWNWDNYFDYLNCLLFFSTLFAIVFVYLIEFDIFIEILGFIGLGIESTLPLPQLISNYKNRGTDGFSLITLSGWFLTDQFKIFYFFYTKAPIQFIICGLIQLFFDTVIVFQVIIFSPTVKKWLGIADGRIALLEEEEESLP